MDLSLEQNGHGELSPEVCPTLSPNPSPTPPVRERGTVDPLELIAEGRHSVESICRASGMSILELAEHVCTPRNLEALARVTQLHAIEQEMMLGKLKRKALMRLAELTDEVAASSADEIRAAEVMRKACVDLIRYRGLNPEKSHSEPGGSGGGGPRARGYHPDTITPAFEAEVLEALEKLGEDREEYPQITQITQMNSGGFKNKSESGNGDKTQYKPRACGESQGPPRRTSGSVPPDSPPPELATRTGGTPMPPVTPRDGSIGQGQSRSCPGCPRGEHEGNAVPGTRHYIVGLDHAHPP